MRMRIERTKRSDGTERFEILLGEIVYVLSLEKGKKLADWIYELHPTAQSENQELRELFVYFFGENYQELEDE